MQPWLAEWVEQVDPTTWRFVLRSEVTGPLEVTLTTPQPTASPPNDLASIYSNPIYDAAAATAAGEDEQAPALPGVELLCIDDAQARVSAVQSGEADIALKPPSQARGALAGNDRAFYLQSDTAFGAAFLQLAHEGRCRSGCRSDHPLSDPVLTVGSTVGKAGHSRPRRRNPSQR